MLRRSFAGMLAALASSKSIALYDPAPKEWIKNLPGSWRGALTYRDWSRPDRLVTLPCHMNASLTSPSGVSLFFAFDDGPGKTVYSYDRWAFDFRTMKLVWSGIAATDQTTYDIASTASTAGVASLVFWMTVDGKTMRQTLESSAQSLRLKQVEIDASGHETFRNSYEMRRTDA